MTEPCSKIVLAGGTGYLGRLLSGWYVRRGWDVVVLTRKPVLGGTSGRFVIWNGRTIGDWTAELEGARAVINLAGRSVNCRYHRRTRREILCSRVDSTRVIRDAIRACHNRPQVWLNASTATIYKHSLDVDMDEANGVIAGTTSVRDEFSVQVAQAWERELFEGDTPGTRRVALRMAMVLGNERGSVLPVLRRLARLGLGGPMAGGRQFVSWIHETDLCRCVDRLIEREHIDGPVNIAAPYPITNGDMMRILRKASHAPLGLPATRWMLEVGALILRTETELMLKSRRVVPGRLLADGFEFCYPTFQSAIDGIMHGDQRPSVANRVA
jgi:uncharacterized protein (TIGR01777 family)